MRIFSLLWSSEEVGGGGVGGVGEETGGVIWREGRRWPVVFARWIAFPDEFRLLSRVTAVVEEFRRRELSAFAIGVSGVKSSIFRDLM